MRRLLLIRHSKSSWNNPLLDDHERPLNKRGKRDAPFIAKQLLDRGEQLDAVFSSSAIRALGIATPISQVLDIPLIPCTELYTFSAKNLLKQLQQLPDNYQKAAIVGHNPAISDVANALIENSVGNIPTSAVLALDIFADKWASLSQEQCHLDYFIYPKMFTE